jgi:hypothetical protein
MRMDVTVTMGVLRKHFEFAVAVLADELDSRAMAMIVPMVTVVCNSRRSNEQQNRQN